MLFLQPRMLCPVPFSWLTIPSGLFALNETSSDLYAFPDFPHPSLAALNLSYPIFSIVVLVTITCRLFNVWYPPLDCKFPGVHGSLVHLCTGPETCIS